MGHRCGLGRPEPGTHVLILRRPTLERDAVRSTGLRTNARETRRRSQRFLQISGGANRGAMSGSFLRGTIAKPVEVVRQWSLRSVAQTIVITAPVAAFIGAGWAHRIIIDDGFIYLRVVQQIRAGNGPVFSDGQRVEAFTGPMWVALLAAADMVTPIRLEWIAVVLGLVACAFGITMAIAGARRLARTEAPDSFVLPFGLLVFVAILPSWVFATSGLETGLSFAWLGLSFWLLVDWGQSRRRISSAAAFVLGLGWLVRPELVLFSATFLVLLLGAQWREDRGGDRGRLVVAMIALPVAYQVFRMGFYGSLVTNTAIAKEAASTNWGRGWNYFHNFTDPYWLWVPGVLLVAGGYIPLLQSLRRTGEWRTPLVPASFVFAAVLVTTYVIAIGGDYIHGRLFLPALFAVCAPVAVVAATRRHLAALLIAPWVLVAVLAFRPPEGGRSASFTEIILFPRATGEVTVDDFDLSPRQHWYSGRFFYVSPSGSSSDYRRLDAPLKADVAVPAVALYSVGLRSYALGPDFNVIDVFGLADPLGSHFISTPPLIFLQRRPGHEKPMPSVWFAARVTPAGTETGPDELPNFSSPLIPVTHGKEFHTQVAWARAALRCPEIRGLMAAADGPLTAGRFFDNFLSSFSRTRIRIPADPKDAYHRFCGPGIPSELREADQPS
jgi:arabinofuranosyltransferase